MEESKNKFLKELEKGLGNHQDKKSILLEYEAHIEEILIENFDCEDETELMARIISRLGSPEEISAMWKEELSVSPSNMKWLFILMNILFFGGGSLLTYFHNVFQWQWLSVVWGAFNGDPNLNCLSLFVFLGAFGL